MDPGGTIGYRVSMSGIDVLDLNTFLQTGTLPVGDTIGSSFIYGSHDLTVSRDGSLLAVITDHGVSLLASGVSSTVNFSALRARATMRLRQGAELDHFTVNGEFELGAQSHGIDPTATGATMDFGSLSASIPAGSMQRTDGGFEGTTVVNRATLHIWLEPARSGSYHFRVGGNGVNLSGTSFPISFGLAFGVDAGAVTLGNGEAEVRSREMGP